MAIMYCLLNVNCFKQKKEGLTTLEKFSRCVKVQEDALNKSCQLL